MIFFFFPQKDRNLRGTGAEEELVDADELLLSALNIIYPF